MEKQERPTVEGTRPPMTCVEMAVRHQLKSYGLVRRHQRPFTEAQVLTDSQELEIDHLVTEFAEGYDSSWSYLSNAARAKAVEIVTRMSAGVAGV